MRSSRWSRLLPLLLICQLVPLTAPKGKGRANKHSSLDLYGHVTRDVQARARSSLSSYEARQGLKVLQGSKNGTLSPMMVKRDASVDRVSERRKCGGVIFLWVVPLLGALQPVPVATVSLPHS